MSYDINDPRNSDSPFNLSNVNSPFYNPERAAALSGASIVLGSIGVIPVVFFCLPIGLLMMFFEIFIDDEATACGWTLAVYVGLVIRFLWWVYRDSQKKKMKTDDV